MAKNTKKRAIIYSNVKENKKRAEEISKIKENQINLNDEIIIGMSKTPNNKPVKSKNNKPVKSTKKVNKNKSNSNKPETNKSIQNKENIDKSKQKINNNQEKKSVNLQKKIKIRKIIIVSLVIIILTIGLVVLLKSSLFNIKQINVKITNNKILTESKIKNLSTLNIGQNMYSINKKKAIESIKSEPYVESVKIKRSLPSTLKIEIEERTVKFTLDYNGQYIYVDNQGYILQKASEPNDKIIITGYSTTDLTDGNRLNIEDLEKLSAVMQIMKEAENNGLKQDITKIDIQDKNNYKIYFQELGKMAHLGDTTSINDKMTYIKKILEEEANYEGEIFVNVDLNNGEYPHFREKV
ncbi:MAG: FtsQ-type POTRA domain-containing protein [Clostridia bacterium]|nr:FtsQ-type POTRA domain-containing protein [Clostridia bacterium]